MEQHVLEHLSEVLYESLVHTGTMLPVLFVVFAVVEIISHRSTSSRIAKAFSQPFVGPVAAAALGLIPQCGFSVVATTLFVEGMIPIGSLLSAYISTSDEALPVMLSDPASLPWVVPLLATKLVWGAVAGICINAAVLQRSKSRSRGAKPGTDRNAGQDQISGSNSTSLGPACHHAAEKHGPACSCSCIGDKSRPAEIASHAVSRTLRTASMVFVLSAVFNFIGHAAQGRIAAALTKPGLWQPVVAALVGLIPSCATSVALAESFRAGMLSFPATISGLASNSGIGLLILIKEAKSKRVVLTVFGLLVFASVLAGVLASLILPSGYLVHQ